MRWRTRSCMVQQATSPVGGRWPTLLRDICNFRWFLALGKSLTSLTPKLGLRMLLKLMRGPAAAAGLGSLQKFLEAGFDDFQTMHGSDEFLKLIALREADWIQRLFEEDAVACETKLNELLAGHTAIS